MSTGSGSKAESFSPSDRESRSLKSATPSAPTLLQNRTTADGTVPQAADSSLAVMFTAAAGARRIRSAIFFSVSVRVAFRGDVCYIINDTIHKKGLLHFCSRPFS